MAVKVPLTPEQKKARKAEVDKIRRSSPEYKAKQAELRKSPEYRARNAAYMRASRTRRYAADPSCRDEELARNNESIKKLREDPEYRAKHNAKVAEYKRNLMLDPESAAKERARKCALTKRRMATNLEYRAQQRALTIDGRRRRLATDPYARLVHNLRGRIKATIVHGCKKGKALAYLSESVDFYRDHLTSLLQPDMTWDNYGEWHIDHIRPLASFDLTDQDQIRLAWHWTNLQPLWGPDNSSKGSLYDGARHTHKP